MIDPIPVSLITGFLGAGKTTLLNSLLQQGELTDTALIINEFGDVGIDHLLVETADEGIVEMSDGCLCCTIRGDLIDTLSRLINRPTKPTRIIIESTGLADPAPILQAIMGHPVLSDMLRLDGVITLVDCINGMNTLDDHEEAVKQVAVADRIVLTKLKGCKDSETLKQRIAALNPTAPMFDDPQRQPGFSELFNSGLYDPKTKTADVARWLNDAALESQHGHHHHDVNRHDSRIRAFTLLTDKPVSAAALASFIDLLRSAHGPNLLRVKGIIRIAEDQSRPVVIHGVQQIFHPPATLPAWPDDDRRTRLVMITKDLSEDFVRKLFDAFVGNTAVDTADQQALQNNPLAIPGFRGS
ncbi:MAG: GTP-binding protein [Rhizobiaceae bacterium]|nr:GTP-binding protein [Rhizobiaceae bacterium]